MSVVVSFYVCTSSSNCGHARLAWRDMKARAGTKAAWPPCMCMQTEALASVLHCTAVTNSPPFLFFFSFFFYPSLRDASNIARFLYRPLFYNVYVRSTFSLRIYVAHLSVHTPLVHVCARCFPRANRNHPIHCQAWFSFLSCFAFAWCSSELTTRPSCARMAWRGQRTSTRPWTSLVSSHFLPLKTIMSPLAPRRKEKRKCCTYVS